MAKEAMLMLLGRLCLISCLLSTCFAIYKPDDQYPPAYCTVFGDITKSGGSTIKWALETAQPAEQRQPGLCVVHVYHHDMCDDVARYSSVIEGHSELVSRLENAKRNNCSFFTMMSHPVDRLVSQFFDCLTDHDTHHGLSKWCDENEDDEPLMNRLVQFAVVNWRNYALNMIGVTCTPQQECAPEQVNPSFNLASTEGRNRLEMAKRKLSTYDAVGIIDHWDLSMKLYDAKVTSPVWSWSDITYPVNAGTQSLKREELLYWARENHVIRYIVEGDLLLYEHGLSLFKQQTMESLGT